MMMDRRRLLTRLGWGIGAAVGARLVPGDRLLAWAGDDPPAVAFHPDVEVALKATRAQASILPGDATAVWSLQGQLLRGDRRTLESPPSGAIGPTFRVRTGQKLRVVFTNDIPQKTILHWHGLRVPAAADGHPRFAVPRGGQYVYEFEIASQPGTYWYHAHPDMRTGEQVYRGLAGPFIVEDAPGVAQALPAGPFDVALVIQDRLFDSDNQLRYLASPMDRVRGMLGDRILVNGTADFVLRVATRAYRLRLLNGSNSRIYRLAWSDGSALTVIGTDGGLLEAPVQRPYVMLAPGERIELWADFGARAVGSELALVSLPFDAMTPMGPMGRGEPVDGTALTIAKVKVDRPSMERQPLPARLTSIERYRFPDAVNASAPRRIVPTMGHMAFGMNGRAFEMNVVGADERVKLGALEAWEFDNTGAGGMMGGMGMMGRMPHPFHIHGGQFQVVRREGVAHAGYVDGGWKDTVLVMPGERATVLMRYLDYPGLFLYHCHNLEHEDSGMMRNLLVSA
jgi:FtsP/CotA-like multicopper oxidase with cupredoxin domain